MTEAGKATWHERNQRHLMAALGAVRSFLERHAEREAELDPPRNGGADAEQSWDDESQPPALERICEIFSLSPFERKILLLCAGPDLDGSFGALCGAAQGDPRRAFPTFGLALAAFPDAHWSALTPSAPLRFWRLVEVVPSASLTAAPLTIDERVLHHLAGVPYLDERLAALIEAPTESRPLVPSHSRIAERVGDAWLAGRVDGGLPVIHLCGPESLDMEDVAATACATIGLELYTVSASALPSHPKEIDDLARLWDREAALGGCALLVKCEETAWHDPALLQAMLFTDRVHGVLLVTSRERLCKISRPMVTFEVARPLAAEQRMLWEKWVAGGAEGGEQLGAVVSHFDLGSHAIGEAVRHSAIVEASLGGDRLWESCRAVTRPGLERVTSRIESRATWEDLVLPAQQIEMLREIALQVRQRSRVYHDWGFAARSSRGLGIGALFEGGSGTGKTMAAEVLANELKLDLYRIDLSQVVSKYIGETEKNLRQIFDAAESGGAILLFDEADALFGKRSEVNDSHDRYANIEISYLLQRMEEYRGLSVLTTNMKGALDTAFLRRIRFVVHFPFPDAAYRAEIWRRIFPPQTPTGELDLDKLARLSVSGGNIRNIALNAAFLAAGDGGEVRMTHLLRAVRGEYAKLEKKLSSAEIGGWE
jgi:hypothetical protein